MYVGVLAFSTEWYIAKIQKEKTELEMNKMK